ncbi:hypothetical protein ACTXT7_014816, partial [Hymenolepis weldensis]
PPWIDSVANGGRPPPLLRPSPPLPPPTSSNKIRLHLIRLSKLRIGWMAENLHHHVTIKTYGCLQTTRRTLIL